jgi:hypothetical protein
LDLVAALGAAEELALGLDLHEQRKLPVDERRDRGRILEQFVADAERRRDLLDRLVHGAERERRLGLRAALGHTRSRRRGGAFDRVADHGAGRLAAQQQILEGERQEQLVHHTRDHLRDRDETAAGARARRPAALKQRALHQHVDVAAVDHARRPALPAAGRVLDRLVARRLDERAARVATREPVVRVRHARPAVAGTTAEDGVYLRLALQPLGLGEQPLHFAALRRRGLAALGLRLGPNRLDCAHHLLALFLDVHGTTAPLG